MSKIRNIVSEIQKNLVQDDSWVDSIEELWKISDDIIDQTSNIINRSELQEFFMRKQSLISRTQEEQDLLLTQLTAKVISIANENIFKNWINLEVWNWYYTTISKDNSKLINEALDSFWMKKYKKLKNNWFIPTEIVVDKNDLRIEIPEVINGITRHEIWEVMFNNWLFFTLSQHKMEVRFRKIDWKWSWRWKDFWMFINAVWDPRVNYFSSKLTVDAWKEIMYAEISGLTWLIKKIWKLPVHHQFLILVNAREAETYAPSLVKMLKKDVDYEALSFYEKNKNELKILSRTPDIKKFYELATVLWAKYVNIVDVNARTIQDYKNLLLNLPMRSWTWYVYDNTNWMMLPMPMDAIKTVIFKPGIVEVSDLTDLWSTPWSKLITPEDASDILDQLNDSDWNWEWWPLNWIWAKWNAWQETDDLDWSWWSWDSKKQNESLLDRINEQKNNRWRGKKNAWGFWIQQSNWLSWNLNKNLKKNAHKQVFKWVENISRSFQRLLRPFMPKDKPWLIPRRESGTLRVADYIRTVWKSNEIYLENVDWIEHFAIFSIIIDNSWSTKWDKIWYFKTLAYCLAEWLSRNNIPFEIMSYGHTFESWIDVIHAIDSETNFTRNEKNILAWLDAHLWQLDVNSMKISWNRLIPLANSLNCKPFYIIISDGLNEIWVKYQVEKLRSKWWVVLWIWINIPQVDKKDFILNFWTRHWLLVDDFNNVPKEIIKKLTRESNRMFKLKVRN